MTRNETSTTCGSAGYASINGYMQVEQIGTTLSIGLLNQCGDLIYPATGIANESSAVVTYEIIGQMNDQCSYEQHFTETIIRDGDTISGEMRFTLWNSDGCHSVGPFPCEYVGTVSGTLCHQGECLYDPYYCQ